MTDTSDDSDDDGSRHGTKPSTGRSAPRDGEWSLVAQRPYEPDSPEGLTTTIVHAVAEAEGVPPREVKRPPLYEVVDTAALERALAGRDAGAGEVRSRTEFGYRGYRVVVRSDGWVLVHECEDR